MNNVYEEVDDRAAFDALIEQHTKDNPPLDTHKRDRELAIKTAILADAVSGQWIKRIKTDQRPVHKASIQFVEGWEMTDSGGWVKKAIPIISKHYAGE